jgi:hypothetical protein
MLSGRCAAAKIRRHAEIYTRKRARAVTVRRRRRRKSEAANAVLIGGDIRRATLAVKNALEIAKPDAHMLAACDRSAA